ncbi:hypothetical protein LXA43DRAFT_1057509 [Ganoderma leucocontextum]|nr:hypothetical protein LXA43DRAFT_1057509 [Ganoderma leucocontextum]
MVSSAISWRPIRPFVNITVDDRLGDPNTGLSPVYLPTEPMTWNVGSPHENCTRCRIQPWTLDLNQIHERTWHDATHTPTLTPATITVSFTGSAVYVFNIVPNTLPDTTTFANISFTIDGKYVGSFTRAPDSSSAILYNYLVYRNTTLKNGLHTLVMSAGGGTKSLVLFDYLLYTTDINGTTSSPPQPSSSGAPVGAILGAVVGGVALALLGVVIGVSCLRIRRRTRPKPTLKRIILPNGGHEDDRDGHPGGDMGVYRGRGGSGAYFAQPMIPTVPISSPMMRPLNRSATHSPPHLAPAVYYGSDAHPSLFDTDVESHSTAGWSSKRRAELTQRLGALHRRMSLLSSSTAPSRSQVSGGSGTETEIRELEAEIAELRRVLASLSEQFADERVSRSDPLPVYTA